MKVIYALNHHWLHQAVLNYVISRDSIVKKSVQLRDQIDLYPYKNEETCMALVFALLFITSVCGSQVAHGSYVCHSDIWNACHCLVGQVGQQLCSTFNSGSDTHFGMRINEVIKIVSYTKMACCYSTDSQNLNIEVF